MKENIDQFDLLIEILKLYKKFGKERFELLSNTLKDKTFPESLNSIVDQVQEKYSIAVMVMPKEVNRSNIINTYSSKRKSNHRSTVEDHMDSLIEKTNKGNLSDQSPLVRVLLKLRNNEYLQTFFVFKSFAYENNLVHLIKKDRKNSVYALMRYITSLPVASPELEGLLKSIELKSSSRDGDTFSKWSTMIMGEKHKEPSDEKHSLEKN